jgi:hypothetical protein
VILTEAATTALIVALLPLSLPAMLVLPIALGAVACIALATLPMVWALRPAFRSQLPVDA